MNFAESLPLTHVTGRLVHDDGPVEGEISFVPRKLWLTTSYEERLAVRGAILPLVNGSFDAFLTPSSVIKSDTLKYDVWVNKQHWVIEVPVIGENEYVQLADLLPKKARKQ